MNFKQTFRANGKLLLSGEYFVLDGAEALALPTKYGQTLNVEIDKHSSKSVLNWHSYDVKGREWFSDEFSLKDFSSRAPNPSETSIYLQKILSTAKSLDRNFCSSNSNHTISTHLEFPREWGLGSSSTLIHNISQWAKVNPFTLLSESFGGSGYDLACAGSDAPIIYQIKNGQPSWKAVDFLPPFHDNLYFIYLGKKQNSREGIKRYRQKVKNDPGLINEITLLSHAFFNANKLTQFQKLIVEHEKIVAATLELPRAKDLYFEKFEGEVKSLGAWGGDFVIAACNEGDNYVSNYCNKNGFPVFFKYKELILNLSK